MIDCNLERGGSFEIGRPRSRVWKNFGRSWTREVGGLENRAIFTLRGRRKRGFSISKIALATRLASAK